MKNNKSITRLCLILCMLIVFLLPACHKEHQHNVVILPRVEATCTKTGLTEGSRCATCGKIIKQQEIIPLRDHNYDEWEIVTKPGYLKDGLKVRKCHDCNYQDTEIINALSAEEYVNDIIAQVVLPKEIKEDIVLPTKIEDVTITWKTSNSYLLSSKGNIIARSNSNKEVTLIATYMFDNFTKDVNYDIIILGYTDYEKLEMVMESLTFPQVVTENLNFNNTLGYGVQATYISSNPEIISNEGLVSLPTEETIVTITIILELGEEKMEKSIDLTVSKSNNINKHQIIEYAKDYSLQNQVGLKILDNRMVLDDNVLEATYYSDIIETLAFTSLVGSWAAISSEHATCELKISLRVNGVWSEEITYSPWGLGLNNASHDQTKDLIKLNEDEVSVLASNKADAIKYSITLKRDAFNVESPKLALVSFAILIPNYRYDVNVSELPKNVCYDVPKLYQGAVPSIGNSICSPTSTTMLLKYHGFDFTAFDSEYEHRYIAKIVYDHGNNIYGNWVYNTVTMGAYGLNAYVARMYSINELIYHLATVGPVALSVKGQMTSTAKDYYTGGHLLVAIGYKYIDNVLYIICNDPNVPAVYCEYSISVINNTWRNIAYVIEK